jgi:hypothetical protein
MRDVIRLLGFLLTVLAAVPARAADYCGYGHATAVLLVDRTTRFDATDRSIFLDATGAVIDRLGAGDRLVAFTMTGAFTGSKKIIDRCKPGCPEEGFFAGLLSACSPTVAHAALQGFTADLAGGIAGMLKEPEETAQSDLFRTVAEATRATAADAGDKMPVRTVILFSDLLENSAMLPERELRRLGVSAVLQRLHEAGVAPPDVAGATIRVFGFGRDDAPGRPPLPQDERRRVAAVWAHWFKAGGAAAVEIGFR